MKKGTKNLLTLLLAVALLCGAFAAGMIFADESEGELKAIDAEANALLAEMVAEAETEPEAVAPLALSLEDALAGMQDSVQMKMIEIQKLGDKAVMEGAVQGIDQLNAAADALDAQSAALNLMQANFNYLNEDQKAQYYYMLYNSGSTSSADLYNNSQAMERLKVYAKEMVEPNDKARRNALDLSAKEMYYGLRFLEQQVDIARENYDVMTTLYENAKLKYKLGTISKMDLLNAESDLNAAKDTKLAAEDGLAQMKMGFNIFFGYNLMQDVTLTSDIEEKPLPGISVEDGVALALQNRNEVKEAKYRWQEAQKAYSKYRGYPSTSKNSQYLAAKAQFLAAEAAYNMYDDNIEMDVRTKYMKMVEAYEKLQTAKTTADNAKETARLAQLQYKAGYCTWTLVQQAQMGSYSAQIALSQAKLDYNLAVENYVLSTDVGTEAATLVN